MYQEKNQYAEILLGGGIFTLILGFIFYIYGFPSSQSWYLDLIRQNDRFILASYIFFALGIILIISGLIFMFIKSKENEFKPVKIKENGFTPVDIPKRICSKCGHKIPYDSSICPYCRYMFWERKNMVKCKYYKPSIIVQKTTQGVEYAKSGICKLYHKIPMGGCSESCPDFEPLR